jgi:hypothetical protein
MPNEKVTAVLKIGVRLSRETKKLECSQELTRVNPAKPYIKKMQKSIIQYLGLLQPVSEASASSFCP